MPWSIEQRDNRYCVIKDTDGSIEKCHPSREAAQAHMRALYASEENMSTDFIFTEYVSTAPGEPFRLLPFGKIVKNGKPRKITPELAKRFRLPHFRPAIKLGSHADDTAAGGHIVGLEVRSDGLYAIPELTDKGAKALAEGDYRYHSPEVAWEGGFEDPTTGEIIEGPLIVGDALLHMPHLGEAAALYTVTPLDKGERTMQETVEVPRTLWEKFEARIDALFSGGEPEPEPQEQEPQIPEEYQAAVQQRDQFKAELEELKAESERREQFSAVRESLNAEEFGAAITELAKEDKAIEMLAGMNEDQRTWVIERLKALSAQIDESNLTEERGSEQGGDDLSAAERFQAAIKEKQDKDGMKYLEAYQAVKNEQPELVEQYEKE